MDQSLQLLSLDVPCDHEAPAVVRHALSDVAPPGPLSDDGLLVVSELVTNAVLHSDCAADHLIEVRADLFADRLMISVHDPGMSGRDAEPRSPADEQSGGWGLRIIDRLARRWGTERPDGYLVWAELARS